MSTKVFNTRLQLKYDSFENWSKLENQFKLLAGEIAVVNVPAETGEVASEPAILFKVGNGEDTFNGLPWASGLAADVHAWAKAETKPEYAASEIKIGEKTVATDLADIWAKLSTLTGEEEGGTSISDMIAAGIKNLGSASVSATGKYVTGVSVTEDGKLAVSEADLPTYTLTTGDEDGTVKFNGTDVAVKGLGSAAYAETTAFDAAGTGAIEAGKVLGTNSDVAGTATVHGALKSAAAAQSAAEAAQATADNAYVLPEGGIEEDLSANVKASLAKADSALQEHQDISHLATKETVNGIDERLTDVEEEITTFAKQADLEVEIERATKAEAKALEDAKAYADEVKKSLLGDELDTTFNTLKAVQDWVDTHGVQATELATALAAETKAREEADTDFDTRVSGLEDKVDVEKVSTAISDAIAAQATTDAATYETKANAEATYETKANAEATYETKANAEATYETKTDAANKLTEAKGYTDAEINKLHTVAKTGKIEDLTQEVEYIIFNCGTASTLVSEPITE